MHELKSFLSNLLLKDSKGTFAHAHYEYDRLGGAKEEHRHPL